MGSSEACSSGSSEDDGLDFLRLTVYDAVSWPRLGKEDGQLTSFIKSAAMRKANAEHDAETAHGRKYGYRIQKLLAKTLGHRSCGLASCPPIKGLFIIRDSATTQQRC